MALMSSVLAHTIQIKTTSDKNDREKQSLSKVDVLNTKDDNKANNKA